MASLVAHLAHAVDMVKVLGYMGGGGQILSSVLACPGHRYPKPVCLHLPLCLLIAPHTSVCHMDKVTTAKVAEWWESVKVWLEHVLNTS